MLNENDVVGAVGSHVRSEGYDILQQCLTTEHGIDIIAKHPHELGRLLVEAKGGTSAREGSPRYTKGFSRSQVFDRVAKCFYTAACMYSDKEDSDRVAMALPNTAQFRAFIDRIKPVADTLRIEIYLVNEDRSVSTI